MARRRCGTLPLRQIDSWAREADKELDFRVEAANLERVRAGLARERSACVVPKVVGVPQKTVRWVVCWRMGMTCRRQ